MKNLFKNSTNIVALVIAVLFFSCDDEDGGTSTLPEASFTYEQTGLSVAFTNTSTEAISYVWDFGDGETSTDESPMHVYSESAAYVVKLTATNEAGSDDSNQSLELVIKITIDGDLSDWDDIDVLSERHPDSSGVVLSVKATSDLENIYFLVEGTDDLYGFVQLYMNTDADTTTGWTPLDHPVSGADFELDAGAAGDEELYEFVDVEANIGNNDWSFDSQVEVSDLYIELVFNEGGTAYEFAIVRQKVPGLAETISFQLGDVNAAEDAPDGWDEHGYLPNPTEDYIELELFK